MYVCVSECVHDDGGAVCSDTDFVCRRTSSGFNVEEVAVLLCSRDEEQLLLFVRSCVFSSASSINVRARVGLRKKKKNGGEIRSLEAF